ncbi:pentatricopeptide repeat-containing protein At3g06920 [Rhizophagus irregularis DAOM 181602=DAOM 197198]|nr:pentatricopeptide repeat-containing protein At3g06920 [Rhizophagus irregularis DAOM 181602=DAOM 197198]
MRSGTNLEEVTKLFTLMHEKKLTPNKTTKPILKNIFRHHLNNDAISWIRELREKNFIDVGFEDMKARNLKPDIYSYVPLIHQLAQHERADEALKLIEVKEQKVHLNTVAYNVFIKVYNMASKYEQTGQIIGI